MKAVPAWLCYLIIVCIARAKVILLEDEIFVDGNSKSLRSGDAVFPTSQHNGRNLANENQWVNEFNHKYNLGNKTTMIVKYTVKGGLTGDPIANPILLDMFVNLTKFIDVMSFGKIHLLPPTILPTILHFDSDSRDFFDEVRTLRKAAGYNYSEYDFELFWRRPRRYVEGAGGSAISGGRVQRFMYDPLEGDFMKRKVLPHEFLHNFGSRHAWHNRAQYGDKYDILGGATMNIHDFRIAHVSAGIKHRYGWIPDEKVKFMTPTDAGMAEQIITLRPFDEEDVIERAGANEFLAVRIDTQYMNAPCPSGARTWCPTWSGETSETNPWLFSEGDNIYLYVSYRAHCAGTSCRQGASLHLVKYKEDSWVHGTQSIDVRPSTKTQTDAFLDLGETFVFESQTEHSVVIKTLHVDGNALEVSVKYMRGKDASTRYERENAALLCERTLACGKTVIVDRNKTQHVRIGENGTSVLSLIKVGEEHQTSSVVAACAAGVPNLETYVYDVFPMAQMLFGADVAIGAQTTLLDYCSSNPDGFTQLFLLKNPKHPTLNGNPNNDNGATGDGLYTLQDYMYFDGKRDSIVDSAASGSAFRTPHYVGTFHLSETHIYMSKCHYDVFCKAEWLRKWNGGHPPSGWFWVMRGGNMNDHGAFWDTWIAPIPNENYTDVVHLHMHGIRWYIPMSGLEPPESRRFDAQFDIPTGTNMNIGQHNGRGWLIAKSDYTSDNRKSVLKYTAHSCTIQTCSSKSYTTDTTASVGGDCKTCNMCPDGYATLSGYIGKRSCFYNSASLLVTIEGYEVDRPNVSGIYTTIGEFRGSPVYRKRHTENLADEHQGLIIRKYGLGNKWKITYGTNTGRLYADTLKPHDLSSSCNCAYVPYPQLIPAMSCATEACTPDRLKSKWYRGSKWLGTLKEYNITITELGSVGTDVNDSRKCSCKTHSHAGSKEHCVAPKEVAEATCVWNVPAPPSASTPSSFVPITPTTVSPSGPHPTISNGSATTTVAQVQRPTAAPSNSTAVGKDKRREDATTWQSGLEEAIIPATATTLAVISCCMLYCCCFRKWGRGHLKLDERKKEINEESIVWFEWPQKQKKDVELSNVAVAVAHKDEQQPDSSSRIFPPQPLRHLGADEAKELSQRSRRKRKKQTTSKVDGSLNGKRQNPMRRVADLTFQSPWVELFDETYQLPYYYNEQTGETQWEDPSEKRTSTVV